MDPPGRFLRRNPKDNNCWEDMSHNDDKCREKCAQVLRDAVAYVGLKEAPPSRPTQNEQHQRQQISPFPVGRQGILMPPMQQRHYAMQYNPFARSAATSSSLMRHHFMTSNNRPPMTGQFSFPDFNPPIGGKHSLAPAGRRYSAAVYAQIPSASTSMPPGTERATKRRRYSNYFDQLGNSQPLDPGIYGNTPELGYEQAEQSTSVPDSSTPRRDSFLGNLSLSAGSEHSGPTTKDFELFPDINVNVDAGMQPPSKNDGDEFSSDFY